MAEKENLEGKVEIDEKSFFKQLYKLADYYLSEYSGIKEVMEQVEFYKGLGYKVRYYKLGDELLFELEEPRRIGFRDEDFSKK